MKKRIKFSAQIRKAIDEAPVSRYALCQRVGVAESVLSRFMSGKQGLTLDTLDRLAEALGLVVSVGVQRLPQSKPKGRKAGKGDMVANISDDTYTPTEEDWQTWAKHYAMDAYKNNFPSRRGVFVSPLDKVIVYNNNPYAADPKMREEETERFKRRLAVEGIKVLGYATYGGSKTSPDYTYAMILDCGQSEEMDVMEIYEEAVRESFERLEKARKTK